MSLHNSHPVIPHIFIECNGNSGAHAHKPSPRYGKRGNKENPIMQFINESYIPTMPHIFIVNEFGVGLANTA